VGQHDDREQHRRIQCGPVKDAFAEQGGEQPVYCGCLTSGIRPRRIAMPPGFPATAPWPMRPIMSMSPCISFRYSAISVSRSSGVRAAMSRTGRAKQRHFDANIS
jgi:hypothetical protein